jgi:2-keto-4-pentenoate hydratase
MAGVDLDQLARRQLADYDRGEPGSAFAEEITLTLKDAYQVQSLVADLRIARGERVIGYKVGCTSPLIRKRLGAERPVFGRLFEGECFKSGSRLPSARFCNPAIEGELAVELSRDLEAGADQLQIRDAIGSVFPVIELHNLIFRRSQPSPQELVANNAIHAGFVRGDRTSAGLAADSGTLRIDIDTNEVALVAGTELIQTVLNSLGWLTRELSRHGFGLKARQTVLCGSVADLFAVAKGHIKVTTDCYGDVECTIENDSQERA